MVRKISAAYVCKSYECRAWAANFGLQAHDARAMHHDDAALWSGGPCPLCREEQEDLTPVQDMIHRGAVHHMRQEHSQCYHLLSEAHLVEEVLQRLSSKQRPRENRLQRQKGEFMATFVTKRTFLCSIPTLSLSAEY